MKSKTAKQIIDNDALVMNNGDRMVDAATAYEAVEIAEREAEERAVEAFKSSCKYQEGCYGCGRKCAEVWGFDTEAMKANARLIAAAPELLEALQGMTEMWKSAADKFDWGKSCLDAETIQLLNEAPGLAHKAIRKALEG